MAPINHPEIYACLGMVIGLYGVLYLEVARRPEHGFLLGAIGLVGKALGPVGALVLVLQGQWPMKALGAEPRQRFHLAGAVRDVPEGFVAVLRRDAPRALTARRRAASPRMRAPLAALGERAMKKKMTILGFALALGLAATRSPAGSRSPSRSRRAATRCWCGRTTAARRGTSTWSGRPKAS
jgi:hypothetical protein